MTAKPAEHPWSFEALFSKALVYVAQMESFDPDDWQFGFWSSLSLEMLARTALASISPTLLASRKDWRHIHYALGQPPTSKRFTPNSITTAEVLAILAEVLPDFTMETADFCALHLSRRNAELHSGEDAFGGLGTSAWLPRFYASCEILLRSVDKGLGDFVGTPEAAQAMIGAMRDTASKAVAQEIDEERKSWAGKSPDEQKRAREQAANWATRHIGHRVTCPACGSPAIVRGSTHGPVRTVIDEDGDVVQKQMMLPSSFECIACGLKISGLSKLASSGLGDAFTSTSISSPAEFFELYTEQDLEEARAMSGEPQFEEDFNEFGRREEGEFDGDSS